MKDSIHKIDNYNIVFVESGNIIENSLKRTIDLSKFTLLKYNTLQKAYNIISTQKQHI